MKKKLFLLLAVIMSLSQLLAQESITIGTGTTTTGSGPIPGFYGNHRSLQLFTAAELNQPAGCMILSVALDVTTANASSGRNVRIYMKEVTESTVASTQVVGTLTDGATLVYATNGQEPCTSNTWNEFLLQTPFIYSGTSNLMVIFEGEGCTSTGGCSVTCRGSSGNMAWSKVWDATAPSMTTAISASNTYRINTRFNVIEVDEDYCYPPMSATAINVLSDEATIVWSANENASGVFGLEYKLSENED